MIMRYSIVVFLNLRASLRRVLCCTCICSCERISFDGKMMTTENTSSKLASIRIVRSDLLCVAYSVYNLCLYFNARSFPIFPFFHEEHLTYVVHTVCKIFSRLSNNYVIHNFEFEIMLSM